MQIYPAIDLWQGQCVRLQQGDFEKSTIYSEDPVRTAQWLAESGAHDLHLVDLSGAKNPEERQLAIIERILAGSTLKVQCGGGIRHGSEISALLKLGVKRVVIGSIAVNEPVRTLALLESFDPNFLTLALDVRAGTDGEFYTASAGWQETSSHTLVDSIRRYQAVGITRILCTDIARDGMMQGPNCLLYRKLVEAFPDIEFQASGGVRHLEDLRDLEQTGVHSAIVGRALYEGTLKLAEALTLC